MKNLPLLITVRHSSSRLPGKCLLPFGGLSVLGHCISRAKAAKFRPIVCTSLDPSDDIVVVEAEKCGAEFHRGDLYNKLVRWNSCIEEFNLDFVHIVDGDDPFFDPVEIMNVVELFRLKDLHLIRTSMRSDSGLASLGLTLTHKFSGVLSARSTKLRSQDLDVIPWSLLLEKEDKWVTAQDNFVLGELDAEIFRLTLDYPEDYKILKFLAEKFGPGVSRFDLENFLQKNPEIAAINKHRTADFLNNKSVQLSNNFSI